MLIRRPAQRARCRTQRVSLPSIEPRYSSHLIDAAVLAIARSASASVSRIGYLALIAFRIRFFCNHPFAAVSAGTIVGQVSVGLMAIGSPLTRPLDGQGTA